MNERRKIGGMEKSTYLDLVAKAGGNTELAALDFDIRQCLIGKIEMLDSKIDRNVNVVQTRFLEIKEHCTCQEENCEKKFIKRVSEKIPLSLFGLIGLTLIVGVLIGLGILEVTDVIDLSKLLAL
jgi:hypothetical protein